MKKILVLTADAGYGHRSAALAIGSALQIQYGNDCEVILKNPLEDERTPAFLRESQYDYDKIIKNMPELYRVGFALSDAKVPTALTESIISVFLFEGLRETIQSIQPDVIVSTYPLYQVPVHMIKTIYGLDIPYFTVITDLVSIHQFWYSDLVQGCMVPNEFVRQKALQKNLSANKVHVTGIPVHPAITMEKRTPQEIRKTLGLNPDLTTFLFVGSKRVDKLEGALKIFNHFGKDLQLIIVCGKNQELYDTLSSNEWHQPYRLYNFVENMPELMHAADAIVCKAGGLITTESLASGLPIMFIEAIPGQETGNAKYVIDHHAGTWVHSPVETLEALYHWLENDAALLKTQAAHACQAGKADAAFKIADLLMQAPPATKIAQVRPHPTLMKWFANNHINWDS